MCAAGQYGLVLHAFANQGDTSLPDALDTCVAAGAQHVIVQPISIPGDTKLIVYPDGVWYGGITPANVGRIVDEHLAGGRVAEELPIAPGKLDDSADSGA